MEDLKEIFKQAADIAKQVPANMQEAAFNRALDALMGNTPVAMTQKGGVSTKRSPGKRSKSASASSTATGEAARQQRKGGSQGLGPKSAIEWLIENKFFETGKTGPQVQEYLQKKRGYKIGTVQLRTAMFRLVREGIMEREQNEEGHYEYKTA